MAQRGTPRFFGRTQKRCHSAPKMVKIFAVAVPLCIKNEAERHRAFFFAVFAQLQKRCHAASKMKQRDTGLFFVIFCGAFESGATLHQK